MTTHEIITLALFMYAIGAWAALTSENDDKSFDVGTSILLMLACAFSATVAVTLRFAQ